MPYVSMRRGDLVHGWKVWQRKLPERDASVGLTTPDLEPDINQKGLCGGKALRSLAAASLLRRYLSGCRNRFQVDATV